MGLDETLMALRDSVRAFCDKEIAPRAAEIDRTNTFPADLWRKLGELGVHGMTVAEEYGGVANNVDFLLRLVASPSFRAAQLTTALIEHEHDWLFGCRTLPVEAWWALACAEYEREGQEAAAQAAASSELHSPWHSITGWRLNAPAERTWRFRYHNETRTVCAEALAAATFRMTLRDDQGQTIADAEPVAYRCEPDGTLLLEINGWRTRAEVIAHGAQRILFVASGAYRFEAVAEAWQAGEAVASDGQITAPMPGRVIIVAVCEGDEVAAGAPLVVLEAMKMEHTLTALVAARVTAVLCAAGDQVSDGALLVTLTPLASEQAAGGGCTMIQGPSHVQLVEVGPRDGLQNELTPIATATKIALIERLAAAGLTVIEATAFVSPKWVPQMADHEEVLTALMGRPSIVRYPVLVPNLHGLERALTAGAQEIAIFTAASETFCRKNINCSIAESLARYVPVVERARAAGVAVHGYVSCVVGCSYEGEVAPAAVAAVAKGLYEMGCSEISLGDTIGVGTPLAISRLIETVAHDVPIAQLAGHFHDTYGMAVANVVAAWQMGVATFDASVGGLGGCPYAPGAAGNVATEALVYLFDGMGVTTGVALAPLVETAWWIAEVLGRPPQSRVALAWRAKAQRADAR